MPQWGTLLDLQAMANHYIQLSHTLPSPNPHIFVNVNNGPLKVNPLDTKVIQWDIPQGWDMVTKVVKGISFGLVIVLKCGIQIWGYHYVERDSQTR